MPSTRIETRRGWLNGRQLELIEAVHRSRVEAIKIPAGDRDIRLVEYGDDHMIVPVGKSGRYISIEVSLFAGRSEAAKRALFAAIARELTAFDVPVTDVSIILYEVERQNWGMGGVPASDVVLTYSTNV